MQHMDSSHTLDPNSYVPSMRDKAELRNLVQRNEKFAAMLEEVTNSGMSALQPTAQAGALLKFLAEFMWKTLLLMWEVESSLEHSDPKHPRQMIQSLKEENDLFREDLDDCRRSYLKEMTAMRDQIRILDPRQVGHIQKLVYGDADPSKGMPPDDAYSGENNGEQPIMFYEPTRYLPDNLRQFVAEVVEEKLKLLLFRIAEDDASGDAGERERRRSLMQMRAEQELNGEPTAREKALMQQVKDLEELAQAYAGELENIGAGMNNLAKDSKKNETSAAVARIEGKMQELRMRISRDQASSDMLGKKIGMRTKQLTSDQDMLAKRKSEGADMSELKQISAHAEELEAELSELKQHQTTSDAELKSCNDVLKDLEAQLQTQIEREQEEARHREEQEAEKARKQEEREMAVALKEKELAEQAAKQKAGGGAGGVPQAGAAVAPGTGGGGQAGGSSASQGAAGGGSTAGKLLGGGGAAAGGDAKQTTQLRSAVGKMLPKPGATFKQYRTKMLMIRAVMSSMHQGKKEALQKIGMMECDLEAAKKRADDAEAEMERLAMKTVMLSVKKKGKGGLFGRGGGGEESEAEKEEKRKMQAELERLRKLVSESDLENAEGREGGAGSKSKEKIKDLEEQLKEKDREIKRLKDEIARLQAALQELQMQIEHVLSEAKNGGQGGAVKGMRKRLGEQLNWVVKSSHENVFERLYHDALDRLTRMEVLRQTFMKMQREQLVDLISHEEEMGNLNVNGAKTEKAERREKEARQAAYQLYLADELQKLKREQLPTHNRWGNPMTDSEMLRKARDQLEHVYPMGVPTTLPENLGPKLRPLSGPSGTFSAERSAPLTTSELMRYPVHNNFVPGVANFGPLDFRDPHQKFQPTAGGREQVVDPSGPSGGGGDQRPGSAAMRIQSFTATKTGEPGTNFGVIPRISVSVKTPKDHQQGEEQIWPSADGINPAYKLVGGRRESRSPPRGASPKQRSPPGGGEHDEKTLGGLFVSGGGSRGLGSKVGEGDMKTKQRPASRSPPPNHDRGGSRLMNEVMLNANGVPILGTAGMDSSAAEQELVSVAEGTLSASVTVNTHSGTNNLSHSYYNNKHVLTGKHQHQGGGTNVPYHHLTFHNAGGGLGSSSRGSTRPSTAGGNLSSAAPSRPYSAVRKPSKRYTGQPSALHAANSAVDSAASSRPRTREHSATSRSVGTAGGALLSGAPVGGVQPSAHQIPSGGPATGGGGPMMFYSEHHPVGAAEREVGTSASAGQPYGGTGTPTAIERRPRASTGSLASSQGESSVKRGMQGTFSLHSFSSPSPELVAPPTFSGASASMKLPRTSSSGAGGASNGGVRGASSPGKNIKTSSRPRTADIVPPARKSILPDVIVEK
ncbi:unnamed protein product [Amoebophrya sp. A25]|nr:unnamed protein product [Amoebophrya sp. A25]|eukprot:GSA25T00004076001.1